jgi:hypothetical protein
MLLRVRLGRGFPRARISGVSLMLLRVRLGRGFPRARISGVSLMLLRVRRGRGLPVEHGMVLEVLVTVRPN